MLKFIYKFCLISVLTGSLLLLDFGAKGFQLRSAMGAPDTTTKPDAATTNQVNKGTSAESTKIANESLKTGGGEDSDMMATLTMIVVGLVASRLVTCKMTLDMKLAAMGAVTYVGGEIMSNEALKAAMKEMETQITRDKNGNVNKEQVKALERLKESYEKAKKTANTKKMLQMAATAAFAAAAIMAISLYMKERAVITACQTALSTASGACSSMFASSCAASGGCIVPFQTGGSGALASITSFLGVDTAAVIPKASIVLEAENTAGNSAAQASTVTAAGQCPAVGAGVSACSAIIPVNKFTKGFCPIPPGVVKTSVPGNGLYAGAVSKPSGFMAFLEKYILSSAQAFSMIGIASTAAVIFIVAMSKTIGLMVDTFLFSPLNRAIVWGVLGGLSFAASTATANVIKKLDGYISQIDNILKKIKENPDGKPTPDKEIKDKPVVENPYKPDLKDNTFNPNTYDGVDLSGPGGNVIPCLTSTTNTSTCVSFDDASKDLVGNSNLSADTQAQIAGIIRVANGMNGASRISSGTLGDAARLAGSANALRSNLDKLKKGLNEKIKKSGKTFEGESKKFEANLNKVMRDGLKKNNSNPRSMLAGFGGSGVGSSAAVAAVKQPEEKLKKGLAAPAGAIDISSSGDSSLDADLSGDSNKDSKDEGAIDSLGLDEESKSADASNSMDQYDLNNDINSDPNSSIFELISHRYQTSGYQRLFKLKEIQE